MSGIWRRCFRNKMFVFSFIVLVPVILIALVGPLLAPHNPTQIRPELALRPPMPGYWLGTDEFGRDILSRLIYGIRPSMIVALGSTALALLIGTAMGVAAGYFRGWTEQIVLRVIDIVLCFPPILLALMVVGFWGGGVRNLIIIIGIVYAPHFGRIAHSATLQVRSQEFVESELSLGATHWRVLTRSILPNILSPLVIQVSLTVAAAILLESGLSFLGLGVVPPEPSWGQMIGDARGYIHLHPLYVLWPSLCLGVTILAINLMGDSLRDILDPKLKGR